ncbi:MAG: Xaa-Pro aminopeptidase [Cellvibrionales bacterium]|nr:Xaa-Pro aminopeptidase [Cellvibrionales bacterium]
MLKKSDYRKRRQQLMAQLGPNSLAILPAATEQLRSRDTYYRFRQDSDLSYLTGFPEPQALAVLAPGRQAGEYLLFCRERDRTQEIWDGSRQGIAGAIANFAADDAFPIDSLDDILPGLIEGRERLYFSMGKHADFAQRLTGWLGQIRAQVRRGAAPPGEIVNLEPLLAEMRLFKTAAEIALLRRAAKISAEAHCRAMRRCRPGLYEYQLQADIEHHFADCGAAAPAYNSIVGAGPRACVLHYIDNDARIADGDLVLIDAGCEYQGYAADITRTFPANGRFSGEQRALYQIVLAAQQAAIEICRPGRRYDEPHLASVWVITQGLRDLGLLAGDIDGLIEQGAYKDFFMHSTGHWLGLDVHDAGDYKLDGADSPWRDLEPGMVTTIEPGIYVQPDNQQVAARWRGIGIRIEDDVLITAKGPQVLTSGVPKDPAEIEALMRA